MSLIRIRRERRDGAAGMKKPPALWKLVALLILVIILIWYLGRVG